MLSKLSPEEAFIWRWRKDGGSIEAAIERAQAGIEEAQNIKNMDERDYMIEQWQSLLDKYAPENLDNSDKNNNFAEKEGGQDGQDGDNTGTDTGGESGSDGGVPQVGLDGQGTGGGTDDSVGQGTGGGDTGQSGLGVLGIHLDDVTVSRQGEKNDEVTDLLAKHNVQGVTTHRVFQITGSAFRKIIEAEKQKNPKGWMVSVHPLDTENGEVGYNDCKCYVTADGKSGVAVTPDGDIISLFSSPHSKEEGRRMDKLIAWAIANGGRKCDCFANGLQNMYALFGGKPISQTPFNEEYAPEGWDGESRGSVVTIIFPETAEEALATYANYRAQGVNKPSVDLSQVPEFLDEEIDGEMRYGYDRAIEYRDKVLSGEIELQPDEEDKETLGEGEGEVKGGGNPLPKGKIDLRGEDIVLLYKPRAGKRPYVWARRVEEDGKVRYIDVLTGRPFRGAVQEGELDEQGGRLVFDHENSAYRNLSNAHGNRVVWIEEDGERVAYMLQSPFSIDELRKGKDERGNDVPKSVVLFPVEADVTSVSKSVSVGRLLVEGKDGEVVPLRKDYKGEKKQVEELKSGEEMFTRELTSGKKAKVKFRLSDLLKRGISHYTTESKTKKGVERKVRYRGVATQLTIELTDMFESLRRGDKLAAAQDAESIIREISSSLDSLRDSWNAFVESRGLDQLLEEYADRLDLEELDKLVARRKARTSKSYKNEGEELREAMLSKIVRSLKLPTDSKWTTSIGSPIEQYDNLLEQIKIVMNVALQLNDELSLDGQDTFMNNEEEPLIAIGINREGQKELSVEGRRVKKAIGGAEGSFDDEDLSGQGGSDDAALKESIDQLRSQADELEDIEDENGAARLRAQADMLEKQLKERAASRDTNNIVKVRSRREKRVDNEVERIKDVFGDKFNVVSYTPASTQGGKLQSVVRGGIVCGWFDKKTGKVFLNREGIDEYARRHRMSIEEAVRQTVFHEFVSHKGLRVLLGENHKAFLDSVWKGMSALSQRREVRYVFDHLPKYKQEQILGRELDEAVHFDGLNNQDLLAVMQDDGVRADAADEYVAHLGQQYYDLLDTDTSETAMKIRKAWSKVCEVVRRALVQMGLRQDKLTDRDIAHYIQNSYENLRLSADERLAAAPSSTTLFSIEDENPTWHESISSLEAASHTLMSTGTSDLSKPENAAKIQQISNISNSLGNLIAVIDDGQKLSNKELVTQIALALGIEDASSKYSQYKSVTLGNGARVNVRISNHQGNAVYFEIKGSKKDVNVGFVIKTNSQRFHPDNNVNYAEFVYFGDKVENDAERQRAIVEGIKSLVETGSLLQVAPADRVNVSGAFKKKEEEELSSFESGEPRPDADGSGVLLMADYGGLDLLNDPRSTEFDKKFAESLDKGVSDVLSLQAIEELTNLLEDDIRRGNRPLVFERVPLEAMQSGLREQRTLAEALTIVSRRSRREHRALVRDGQKTSIDERISRDGSHDAMLLDLMRYAQAKGIWVEEKKKAC